MERISEKTSFDNGHGDFLAGIIDRPTGDVIAWAVMGPCFTCVKESHASSKVARALAERGVGVLRFDTTGFGASTGDALATNLTTRINDLIAACNHVAALYAPPRIMIGHSMSGTAALSAAPQVASIDTVVTIGSPCDTQTTIARFQRDRLISVDPEQRDHIIINVLGRPVPFYANFVDDLMAGTVAADTARITGTVIAAHAKNDDIVEYENAETIAKRATSARAASVFTLPDTAGHLLMKGSADAELLADKIIQSL